jgi:hypothetical protein
MYCFYIPCDGNSSLHRSTAGRNIWPTMSSRKNNKIPLCGGYEEYQGYRIILKEEPIMMI